MRALVSWALCVGVAAGLLALGCTTPDVRASRADAPNLLLITVDTLRADHLSSYGYRLPTSPNLDRLAASGVRFADATVPWPKTWPATASMLTGKYPSTTGVRLHPRRPLPAEHVTLAEALAGAGYEAGAVVANVNVSAKFGFDQGFEPFLEAWSDGLAEATGSGEFGHDPGKVKEFAGADVVTTKALEVLDGFDASQPFFLWLHYIDPHGPYRPPAAYRDLWADAYPVHAVEIDELPVYQRASDAHGTPIEDLSYYIANYDREIRFFDDQLARLLRELEKRSLRKNTLIVLTSDHGESLDDDGYYLEHGAAPYQPTAGVPLLVVFPGRVPAGRVVTTPVGLVDLLPTIMELLEVPAPPQQGTSLVPTWADAPRDPRPYVFMESGSYEPSQLSVRKGRFKLAHLRSARDRLQFGREELELYDLSTDPGEEIDVKERYPDVVAELRAALETWRAETPRYAGADDEAAPIDEKTHALLKALGYVEH